MKAEEKFNKRSAELVKCQAPEVQGGAKFADGVRVRLFTEPGPEARTMSIHMSPGEALELAEKLVKEARRAIEEGKPL